GFQPIGYYRLETSPSARTKRKYRHIDGHTVALCDNPDPTGETPLPGVEYQTYFEDGSSLATHNLQVPAALDVGPTTPVHHLPHNDDPTEVYRRHAELVSNLQRPTRTLDASPTGITKAISQRHHAICTYNEQLGLLIQEPGSDIYRASRTLARRAAWT